MGKVRIVGPIDDELRDALLKLLGDAGCELVEEPSTDEDELDEEQESDDKAEEAEAEDEELQSPEASFEPSPETDEDVGIVVLSPSCLENGSLDKAMQSAAARGCHVIGVWPPGTEAQDLPRVFEDYGGDTVIWDSGRLRELVSKPDGKPAWTRPDDQPRPERQLKRNKC